MKNLLLLSNSTLPGQNYLQWPMPYLSEFFKEINQILFIPFAGFSMGYDKYESAVKNAFHKIDKKVVSIHHSSNYINAVEQAEAIAIGGGNTFYLYHQLHQHQLIKPIQQKVEKGMPYAGWSAGSNAACPSLKTTNDMPIVEPASFAGLNLVPIQINPHFTEQTIANHGGETRKQRIMEFLSANQSAKVLGIPEGSLLHVQKNTMHYIGNSSAKLFLYNQDEKIIQPNEDLTYLI